MRRSLDAECLRERFWTEWLEQHIEFSVLHAGNGVDITGGQDDGKLRMPSPDLPGQLKATDAAGHHDVRQHDVDLSRIGQSAKRGVRARDVRHRKSQRAQQLACES